jgi:hypothetical protein
MDGSSASMNPKMLGAAMQLMGNKKGQSMLPALGQAAMAMKQSNGVLGVRNPVPLVTNDPTSGLGMNGQGSGIGSQQMIPPTSGLGMNGQGSGIGSQQAIPLFAGGAGQFLSGPSSQMGGYQSRMWNQQRVNPNLNFQAPWISQMLAPPRHDEPQQAPGTPPINPYTSLTDAYVYRD